MKRLYVKLGQGVVQIYNLFELDGWIHQQNCTCRYNHDNINIYFLIRIPLLIHCLQNSMHHNVNVLIMMSFIRSQLNIEEPHISLKV